MNLMLDVTDTKKEVMALGSSVKSKKPNFM
jgi:hypothetical protein